ncbi:MAG TPA: rhodanese-like domain-containing protein [Spirochaetota bacterium]|nr:rhodanese-like domain-containing protein [Spirochaetota bacterium]HOR45204.1 rhodanese-like domain-containing protein [Spirochaetota bacterium]HPK56916.1 rhodanese-like domain-containing protein [Spirochaetota bacterium]
MKKKNRRLQPATINFFFLRDIIFIIAAGLLFSVSSFFVKSGFDIIPKTDNYPRYITKINVIEALHKNKSGALFIDARDNDLFKKTHIPSSVNISWNGNVFQSIMSYSQLIKNSAEIVIYDSSEEKIDLVLMAKYINSLGYPNTIYIFESGMNFWQIAGYKYEKN